MNGAGALIRQGRDQSSLFPPREATRRSWQSATQKSALTRTHAGTKSQASSLQNREKSVFQPPSLFYCYSIQRRLRQSQSGSRDVFVDFLVMSPVMP